MNRMGIRMTKKIKAWAVVAKDKIVIGERDLCQMLIFDKKWRAQNALWHPNEKVVQVTILLTTERD